MSSRCSQAMRYGVISSGTLLADGTEQTLVEVLDVTPFTISGYVDLTKLAALETVVMRLYGKISKNGNYIKYAEDSYVGVISSPLLYVDTRPGMYGIKVTIHQLAGVFRNFEYLWIEEI